MSLEDAFKEAQARVKTLSSTPSNDKLLELYSLFKQGIVKKKRAGRKVYFTLTGGSATL